MAWLRPLAAPMPLRLNDLRLGWPASSRLDYIAEDLFSGLCRSLLAIVTVPFALSEKAVFECPDLRMYVFELVYVNFVGQCATPTSDSTPRSPSE